MSQMENQNEICFHKFQNSFIQPISAETNLSKFDDQRAISQIILIQ